MFTSPPATETRQDPGGQRICHSTDSPLTLGLITSRGVGPDSPSQYCQSPLTKVLASSQLPLQPGGEGVHSVAQLEEKWTH